MNRRSGEPPDIPSFADLGLSKDEVAQLERGEPAAEPLGRKGGTDRSRRPGPRERGRRPGAVFAALATLSLLVLGWASSPSRALPEPLAAGADPALFSANRAMIHVRALAEEPRPMGSPHHGVAREYLLESLRDLGLEPRVQTGTIEAVAGSADGGYALDAATVYNVVARIPGSYSANALLATAHYDSKDISRGASDAAAGVSAILETLRAVSQGPGLANDLIVLFTDGEEKGLLGSSVFVERHPWMADVRAVISLEMRGGGGPVYMFETGEENGWVVDRYRDAVRRPVANSASMDIYRVMPNGTDFTPFRNAGVQGLNFAAIGKARVYHQSYDAPECLSAATLQHLGDQALALVRELGGADLSVTHVSDKGFLSFPRAGLLTFDALWVRLMGAGTLAAWLLAYWVAVRSGARRARLLLGVFLPLPLFVVLAAGAHFLIRRIAALHPEAGALHALQLFHVEEWYVAFLASATLLFWIASLHTLRRWLDFREFTVGALFWPIAAGAAAAIWTPLSAANLLLPAFISCAAACVLASRASAGGTGYARSLLALLPAAAVATIFAPISSGIATAMGLVAAGGLVVVFSMGAIFLLPTIEALRKAAGPARLVGVVGGGALVFLALGLLGARPSSDRPAPSTLVYVHDAEAGESYWGAGEGREGDDRGLRWARERFGVFREDAPEAARFARPGFFAFGYRRVSERPDYVFAPAPPPDPAPPTTEVLSESADGGPVIRICSSIRAEMVRLRFPDAGLRMSSVNGEASRFALPIRELTHTGSRDGCFKIGFLGESPERLEIVEEHLRPGEIIGADRFVRPEDLAPNMNRGSDRAIIRTVVALEGGVH